MKIKTKTVVAMLITLSLGTQVAAMTACDTAKQINGERFTMPEINNYSTYDNADFYDYENGASVECANLPDQWEQYGVGDPYIMRYNGKYYLYVSTKDGHVGVRAWKSDDMLHWTKCTGAGLAEGYVSEDEKTVSAYAPEVYYFNGIFYMYTSPGGRGHYTLTSANPEGPFERITDNYGMSIDGSVFVDDNESMYFLRAANGGIVIHTMDNLSAVPDNGTDLMNTSMGWTEGPMLIKRNGIYYLTYTGNQVTSPGYRVNYVTERDGNSLIRRNSFTAGAGNPVLLNVDEENNFKGLGHSSTVLGPDMDSYYIAYHSLDTEMGPWRSLNIDRLIFNGTQMSVDGSKTNSIAANLPAMSAENTQGGNFAAEGGKTLSVASTGKVFTAEFNYTGNGVKCIVGYENNENYVYASADYTAKKIVLHKVSGGKDTLIAEGTLKNDFDPSVLHTVRISYADGLADVYFDNLRKIADASLDIGAGKIGYEGGTAYYTAFSNTARGYSDRIELKQSGADIGASLYLPDGAYDGVKSYKFGKNSGIEEVVLDDEAAYEDLRYEGAYQLNLANGGDFASYAVYFREAGHYGLHLTYNKKYAGRAIGVQINGGDVQTVILPSVETEDENEIVKAYIAGFEAAAGANIITLYGGDKEVAFISFTSALRAYGNFEYSKSLKEVVEDGVKYTAMFRETEDGHATRGGNRMAAFFGDGSLADCEMEVDMKFISVNTYSAGIILRASNYASSRHDDATSIQGYYIGFNSYTVTFSKYNFGETQTNIYGERHGHNSDLTEHWFKLKAVFNGNKISIYIDGSLFFTYTDAHPFLNGWFGLYSEGAEVVYKNLKIKGI